METLTRHRIRWIWLLLLFLTKSLASLTDSIRLRSVRRPSQNEAIYFGLGLLNPYINYTDNDKRGGVVWGNNYYMGNSLSNIKKKGIDSNSEYRSKVTAYTGKGVSAEKGTYTFELNKQGKAKFNKSRIELKCQHVLIPFRETQSKFSTFTIGKDLVCDIPPEPIKCLRLPTNECPQMVRKGNSLLLDLDVTPLRMFNLELGLVNDDITELALQEVDMKVPFTEKVCDKLYKFHATKPNDTDSVRLEFMADKDNLNDTKTPMINYIKYGNRNCNTSCGTKPVCPEEPGGDFTDFAKYIDNTTNPEKANISLINNDSNNDLGRNDEFKKRENAAYKTRKSKKKTKAELEKDELEKELAESKLLEKDILHLSNPQMLLNKKESTKNVKHRKPKMKKMLTKGTHRQEKTLQNEAMESEVIQKELKHNQSLEKQISHMSELDKNSSNSTEHTKATNKLGENIAVSSKQLHNEQLEKEALEKELLDSKLLETDILHLTVEQNLPNHHNMFGKEVRNKDMVKNRKENSGKKWQKEYLKNDILEQNALEKALKQNELLEKEVLHMGEEENLRQQKTNGSVNMIDNKDGSKAVVKNELKDNTISQEKETLDSTLLEKGAKTLKMPNAQITPFNISQNMKSMPHVMTHEKEAVDSDVMEKEALDRELKESELLEKEVQHMRVSAPGNKDLIKGTGGEIDQESGEEGGSTLVESTITPVGSGAFNQQGIHEKVSIVRELPNEALSSGDSDLSGNHQSFMHDYFKDYFIGEGASGSSDEESGATGDEVSTAANMLSEEESLKRIRFIMKLKRKKKTDKVGKVGGLTVEVGKGGSTETTQTMQMSDANEIAGSEPPLKEPPAEIPGKEVLQKKGRVPLKQLSKKHKV